MKVVLTGGGTGGHFYPLIAVAEALREQVENEHVPELSMYYLAPEMYDEKLLFKYGINFRSIPAGKLRIYASAKNITDMVSTAIGVVKAFFTLFFIYPDVVFSKGGYVSVPVVFAARLLGIPVVIHESDSHPGRANMWAGKFAKRIAVSYPEATTFFPSERVAVTGQPVRKTVAKKTSHGSHQYLELEDNVPVIFLLGGSQGAVKINEVVLRSLNALLPKYQIIHQVGTSNEDEVRLRSQAILTDNQYRSRYKIFGFLDNLAMSMSAGAADLVISRAGSTLFEIAAWGVPSIIIPFTKSNGDHSRKNAFNYARRGAAVVIEEQNLAPHVLESEIDRIISDKELHNSMSENAKNFFDPHAAQQIAGEIVEIALTHEK
jgi:UDP-N-acetylglucosamine--N-acetylmuramyl-(pentapeptide) pyrophosphoryl-undecaprenol N-acetylglucosamine transferase